MLLILLTTLLLAGIAFYQVIQGLFSAMIMTVLTIVAAAVAFNYYEPLAELLASRLGAYAHPAALLGIFVIALYVLREIFDRLIRGNVVMGMWVDRIGGAAFGLLTAFVLVGVLVSVVLLLPFGPTILTYKDYDSNLAAAHGGPPRWAAGLTLGLMKHLSAGPLRTIGEGNSYGRAHDDLQLDAYCVRNRPPGGRASTPPDALDVMEAYRVRAPEGPDVKITPAEKTGIDTVQQAAPRNPQLSRIEEQGGTAVLSVRVAVDEAARNDDDGWWRLPATHFRMVADVGAKTRSFYPVGYLTWSGGRWLLSSVETDKNVAKIGEIVVARAWRGKSGTPKQIVDWIYRIPTKAKPRYVVFRRTAKAAIPLTLNDGLPNPYDRKGRQIALEIKPKKDRVNFKAVPGRFLEPEYAEVSERLPTDLRLRFMEANLPPEIQKLERAGAKLNSCRVAGSVSALKNAVAPGTQGSVRIYNFNRPSRDSLVVQVNCQVNRGFAAGGDLRARLPVMNPELVLDNGQRVPHRGAYLFYESGGQQLYFYYDVSQPLGRFDPVFAQTLLANFPNGRTLGLVFLVPRDEARRIEWLSFGQGGPDFYPESPLACIGL